MIQLEQVTKTYKTGSVEVNALREVTLTIDRGEFVAILGPSGSGKSTMMHVIGCLDKPSTGRYILEDREVGKLNDDDLAGIRNERIGFVFQQFNLVPRISAVENVELPLIYAGDRKTRRRKALAALGAVQLAERATHLPSELSGGEQQRVAIARGLVTEPSLLLADEPTGNLDTATGESLMHLISNLHREGRTVIVVTHDNEVAKYATRVISLADGGVLSDRAQYGSAQALEEPRIQSRDYLSL